MAVGFSKPRFSYEYNLKNEKKNFDRFFTDPQRGIPKKSNKQIDLASWNIANLGLQKRRNKDLELIAHILSKFDIIAVQEVNAALKHFESIMKFLGSAYDMRLTDPAGSQERLAVIYKTSRIRPRQLFGELDYNPNGKIIKGKYVITPKKQSFTFNGKKIKTEFYNFNRNPFLSTWQVVGSTKSFMLANVHIYYGDASTGSAKFENRIAEVFYLAEWARQRKVSRDKTKLYEPNIILMGDMNIPRMNSTDSVYQALKRRGMQPSQYATEMGTTLQEFNTYDQIVFTNDKLKTVKIKNHNSVVVDFDNFIFQDLWNQVKEGKRTLTQFKAWTKFAVSDHRPLFVRLRV